MQKRSFSVRDMCYCAIFTALLVVCAQIRFPAGDVSFTMQTFAIFLALLTLGGFRGSVVVGVYLLMGLVGLPVFSGFQGGVYRFFYPSGGFLIGFMLTAVLYWAITAEFKPEKWGKAVILALAMLPCYGIGVHHMMRFYSRTLTVWDYFVPFVSFLIPDTAKLLLAWFISQRLKRFVK